MPSIIRDHDNAVFISPDYRELTSTKKSSLLKREILMLAQTHGQYAHIRKKNTAQYEVAFSQEAGYLLGESIWHRFDKPYHMVYCEVLPSQVEAILVVVKAGSIFIDTKISIANIDEELAVLSMGEGEFEVYISDDAPISETQSPGKFSFPTKSVKSFAVLDEPCFENLILHKTLELLPVSEALRKQGIGTFPIKPMLMTLTIIALLWTGWEYLTTHKKVLPKIIISVVDPYALFLNTLTSPAPDKTIQELVTNIILLESAPGFAIKSIDYDKKTATAYLLSTGNTIDNLKRWAFTRHLDIEIDNKGIAANLPSTIKNRDKPTRIYSLQNVMGHVVDRVNRILPGNSMTLHPTISYSQFKEMGFTIALDNVPPNILLLIGEQFASLPIVFNTAGLTVSDNGFISGSLTLTALGN